MKENLKAGDHCPKCSTGIMQANGHGISCTNCHNNGESEKPSKTVKADHGNCQNCDCELTLMDGTNEFEPKWRCCTNCGWCPD